MDDARALRAAGWAGIAFAVLSLAVGPLTGGDVPPGLGSNGATFASWYAAHRAGFLAGNYLGIAAYVPGFLQLAVLAARFRAADKPSGMLAALVLATGTFAYAVFACSLVVFQVLPFVAAPGREGVADAMGTLGAVWFALDGLVALPFILAVAYATAKTGALPAWFARLSYVAAVALAAMSLGALTDSPAWLAAGGAVTTVGFVGFGAWILVLSIVQLRLARRG